MKTLIIEEKNRIKRAMKGYMKAFDLQLVGSASNGRKALEMFKEFRPGLVTMDITLPEIEGLACMEKMLKINPSAKVIILTAKQDEHTGIEALRKGARGFLSKTFENALLKDEISGILQKT